jgi:hypothetical protein
MGYQHDIKLTVSLLLYIMYDIQCDHSIITAIFIIAKLDLI